MANHANGNQSQRLTLPHLTRHYEGRHGVDDALMVPFRTNGVERTDLSIYG
ncbi:hypothetical protein [Paenibacillus sp. cl141a]|uniref:hypothetical protein n=1 Tax=Paenibacillus sp. cl141a TaxID=1761877 RepID=UPI0015871979|nr:hypothetical protein [Paenibacillus sp. cl141a]